MRIDDRLWSVALIVLSTAIIYEASNFPRLAGMSVGPGLFPIVLSGALVFAAILLAIGRMRVAQGETTANGLIALPSELGARSTWWRVLAVFGSCILFAALGKTLGFVIVGILALGWLLFAFGARPLSSVLIAVITIILIDLFLVRVMRIPLPLGVLSSFSGWL